MHRACLPQMRFWVLKYLQTQRLYIDINTRAYCDIFSCQSIIRLKLHKTFSKLQFLGALCAHLFVELYEALPDLKQATKQNAKFLSHAGTYADDLRGTVTTQCRVEALLRE